METQIEQDSKDRRGLRKVLQGQVLSNKMQKTVVVSISTYVRHSAYGKYVRSSKHYMVHDEKSECGVGDRVEIIESRPLSRKKRWRVQKIIERAV